MGGSLAAPRAGSHARQDAPPLPLGSGGRSAPSPLELWGSITGLPVLLALAAVLLHAGYCVAQSVCGGSEPADGVDVARRALRKSLAEAEVPVG